MIRLQEMTPAAFKSFEGTHEGGELGDLPERVNKAFSRVGNRWILQCTDEGIPVLVPCEVQL